MENLAMSVNVGRILGRVAALAVLMGTVACGQMGEVVAEPGESVVTQGQELQGTNGLTSNGLTSNGLTSNGLTSNGLTSNGLTSNGLAGAEFSAWFTQNAAQNATLMSYLIKCALPAEESRSFQDTATGTSYTWQGLLGLTPGWASGQSMTEAEQQLISACLAAHLNKFGVHVPISLLGRTAQLATIPYSEEELQSFPRREGCFFGNLFTGEGLFAAGDRGYLFDGESSPRACALSTVENASVSTCAPIEHVAQTCENFCTLDPSGLFYTSCTYNGRTYLPVTTRIRSEDVYTCGDGVCQFTESCGADNAANSCASDCGSCS